MLTAVLVIVAAGVCALLASRFMWWGDEAACLMGDGGRVAVGARGI
jgi:hypothetical protein